jgi:hypothetical protein
MMLLVEHVSGALESEGILGTSTFGDRSPVFWVSYPGHGLTNFSLVVSSRKATHEYQSGQ